MANYQFIGFSCICGRLCYGPYSGETAPMKLCFWCRVMFDVLGVFDLTEPARALRATKGV